MPDYFNICDQIFIDPDVVTGTKVTQGMMPLQPTFVREIASPVVLSSTFQRLDLATLRQNTFAEVSPDLKIVDWDSVNDLITFNNSYTQNYVAAINPKVTVASVVVTPILPTKRLQFRFVVPDGVSPGVNYYFPHATGDGFVDLGEIIYNGSWRHQQTTPITSTPDKRTNGVGLEVRLDSSLLTGTATLDYFSLYLFGA